MNNPTNFSIAKFGTKEHLQQLQNGEFFLIQFNHIETMGRIIEDIQWKEKSL